MRAQLKILNEVRWVDYISYEYFNPVVKSEDKYRKTLQKNFPFDIEDRWNLYPYSHLELPILSKDLLANSLVDEAKRNSSNSLAPYFNVSLFGKPKSNKDLYYDELTLLRYNKGLDKDIIPNLRYKYDMEIRPSCSKGVVDLVRVVGGIFDIEIESTDNDDFFYHWLLSEEMKNGELIFYKGSYQDQLFKIKF